MKSPEGFFIPLETSLPANSIPDPLPWKKRCFPFKWKNKIINKKGGEVKQKTGAGQGYYLLMLFMIDREIDFCYKLTSNQELPLTTYH
jgi:hypothetical protein